VFYITYVLTNTSFFYPNNNNNNNKYLSMSAFCSCSIRSARVQIPFMNEDK